jgi:hypothetical protein
MEGRLWASLGWLKLVKNTRQESIEAIADFRRAIQIAKRTGDRRGEASHLGSLGRAYELLGWNSWSLPPQVWGPDGYGESDYSKRCEQANKECYYRAYQYYSNARHVAVAIGDKQMEERFAADSRRAVSGGGFPTHSSGDLDWRIFSRNPMPDGLRSSSHWDLEPRLKKALVPPGHKR